MDQNTTRTNAERAESAFRAVVKSTDLENEEMEVQVSDLLCNLQHLADEHGFDFNECLERANEHYKAETA